MADKIQPSGRIAENFYLLNLGFVGMYVLDAGESLVAFDAGMKPKAVLAEFEGQRLDSSRVKHVFLTHSDRDHTGGLPVFPNAKVYLARAEVSMLDHTTPRFLGLIYNKPLAVHYEQLEDNQQLRIGGASIKCIFTPGHTAGSMSFLVNGSILVVGDILNLNHGKVVMDRSFMQVDTARQRESIVQLAGLTGVSLLCTAHSGYAADFATAMKEWAPPRKSE
jgi:glyoxylase-like metal-dependent hydrolase (beta-lactamase superfamily II)